MSMETLHTALFFVKLAALAGVSVPILVGLARWAAWRML